MKISIIEKPYGMYQLDSIKRMAQIIFNDLGWIN